MADIKLDKQAEKSFALNERSETEQEKLKQNLEHLGDKERADNFEAPKKNTISEINKLDQIASANISDPATGIMASPAKRQKQVENILAQGLEEIYLNLAPQKQQEFKKMGEETAGKIGRLLAKTKVNIGEIIKLIKKWLSLIPGINKYFLEQEAKLKADELIKLKK